MKGLSLAGLAAVVALVGCGKTQDSASKHSSRTSSGAVAASTAQAGGDEHHAWTGVWQGTIGAAPVRACFGTKGDPDQGSYYSLHHLSLIALDPGAKASPASEGWTERGEGEHAKPARWTLASGPGGTLSGTWSDGGHTQPIRLTRAADLKDDEADAPCGGMTFQRPRIVSPTIVQKPATLDGTAYEKVIADVGAHFDSTIETFALLGDSPAVARINAEAAKVLPKTGGDEVPDYLDCAMGSAGSYGENGEYTHTVTPGLITRRWIAADETTSGFCGGVHPDTEEFWRVWSLTTGAKVDPWDWFSSDAVRRPPPGHPEDDRTIGPALRKLLVAHWSRDDGDCKDIVEDQGDWTIHPTRDGLAFWPELPHVVFACSEDDVISYRELRPLLNAEGRAAIASIVEDVQTLPPRAKAKI
jgi:hypothetical protein